MLPHTCRRPAQVLSRLAPAQLTAGEYRRARHPTDALTSADCVSNIAAAACLRVDGARSNVEVLRSWHKVFRLLRSCNACIDQHFDAWQSTLLWLGSRGDWTVAAHSTAERAALHLSACCWFSAGRGECAHSTPQPPFATTASPPLENVHAGKGVRTSGWGSRHRWRPPGWQSTARRDPAPHPARQRPLLRNRPGASLAMEPCCNSVPVRYNLSADVLTGVRCSTAAVHHACCPEEGGAFA